MIGISFSFTKYTKCKTTKNQKVFVRSGIRTHALIRGPEFSFQGSEEYIS